MVQKTEDSKGNPPREGNQSNFLNHLLHKKGRKATLKLDSVKQETQLVHNTMFKSHFN